MNVFNMIWGFFAFVIGLVLVAVGNPLFGIFISLYSEYAETQVILWLGLISYDIIMLIVFPIAITMNDDNILKKTFMGD